MVFACSLCSNRGGEYKSSCKVVLCSDRRTVAEYEVIGNLDGVGKRAVFVFNFLMFSYNSVVPNIGAVFGYGCNSLKTAGELFNILVSSTGVGCAEYRITELTGKVGGVAKDDAVVTFFRSPVDQSRRGIPIRVGLELFNAFDLCIVKIIILVGVKRNFRKKSIPSLDVELPPLNIDIVCRSVVGAFGVGVVNHSHGEEVKTEFIFYTIFGDVCKTGFGIFFNIGNRGFFTEFGVQGNIVNAVLFVFEALKFSSYSFLFFRLRGLRLRFAAVVRSLIVIAGCERKNHHCSKQQSKDFFHFKFLLFIIM